MYLCVFYIYIGRSRYDGMGVPNMSYPELRMDLGVSPDGHFALFPCVCS